MIIEIVENYLDYRKRTTLITEREKEILRFIKESPMIKQQELAEKVGITRSSVAVHISNLMNKGYIEGKGYVVRKDEYVSIVGGANIDLIGLSHKPIIQGDSNPGRVEILLGGVGRNQAHNLRLLGVDVRMITAFGSDFNGDRLRHNCIELGIDISNSIVVPNCKTSTYLSIVDSDGTLREGINEMDIYEHLTSEVLLSKMQVINRSSVCLVDTNIEQNTIETLASETQIPLFCETISVAKARRIRNILPYIHTLRSDLADIECLLNRSINCESEINEAIDILLSKGIKRVYIIMSSRDIICASAERRLRLSYETSKITSKNGARDSFMAALVWAYTKDMDLETAALAGMASATICSSSHNMVNEQLNESYLMEMMGKIKSRAV